MTIIVITLTIDDGRAGVSFNVRLKINLSNSLKWQNTNDSCVTVCYLLIYTQLNCLYNCTESNMYFKTVCFEES